MTADIVSDQQSEVAASRRTPSLASNTRREPRPPRYAIPAYIAIACGFGWLVFFTLITLHNPILDAFGFRQTQTAISVYWMLHDHALIRYLTPVLRAPWSLPFEVPVYQLIVAALVTRAERRATYRRFDGEVWSRARAGRAHGHQCCLEAGRNDPAEPGAGCGTVTATQAIVYHCDAEIGSTQSETMSPSNGMIATKAIRATTK